MILLFKKVNEISTSFEITKKSNALKNLSDSLYSKKSQFYFIAFVYNIMEQEWSVF